MRRTRISAPLIREQDAPDRGTYPSRVRRISATHAKAMIAAFFFGCCFPSRLLRCLPQR
jgi:hypothetical protein